MVPCLGAAASGAPLAEPSLHAAILSRRYEAVLPNPDFADKSNKYSAVITQRRSQGAGQAQLYATDVGKIKDGMNKPQVSHCACTPCVSSHPSSGPHRPAASTRAHSTGVLF